MELPKKALRLVTIDVDALIDAIGEEAAGSADSYVRALAGRGYVPVPIPWNDGPVARGGQTDLLIVGTAETPVPPPGPALMRAIAFLENAFHISRSMGEPGEHHKERIVDVADNLERLGGDERSMLGAHYVHALRTPLQLPRPMGLKAMDEAARNRVIKALYTTATADGTLYDVVLERFESALNAEGVDGAATVRRMVSPRQVILRFERAEHDPSTWTGLEEGDARLLSWIVARPKSQPRDLEAKARDLDVDPRTALLRIKSWMEKDPTLGGKRGALALPSPEPEDGRKD